MWNLCLSNRMVVLPDKTDYGSFTDPASSGIFVSSGIGGVLTTTTSSTVTSPTPAIPGVASPYFYIQKEAHPPPQSTTSSVSSLLSQQGSGGVGGRNPSGGTGSLASVLQNNNNINSSYTSLTSNLSHRSVGSGNSTSETTRPRNLSHRGKSPDFQLPNFSSTYSQKNLKNLANG